MTRTYAILGTPNYMPPEQAAGDTQKIGIPADIYSLGAILYELLTGRPPFKGTTLLKTLDQVRYEQPVQPHRLRRGISADLETICLKCLEKEPSQRYASAAVLADDLHAYLDGHAISARPAPLLRRAWRWGRRRPALAKKLLVCRLCLCSLSDHGDFQNHHIPVAGRLQSQRQADDRYTTFLRMPR